MLLHKQLGKQARFGCFHVGSSATLDTLSIKRAL